MTVSLAISGQQNTGSGLDILTNIDNLIGSAFNDTLRGNANNNILDGAAGADTLIGGAGNDTFLYATTAYSFGINQDIIVGFVSGANRIDLR